jgi:ribonuclease P protein subunit POP4
LAEGKAKGLWMIGRHVEVLESSDPGLVGVSGVVVDETKNMLVIDHGGKIKKVPKQICILLVSLQNGEKVKINGKKLIGRPEDRV